MLLRLNIYPKNIFTVFKIRNSDKGQVQSFEIKFSKFRCVMNLKPSYIAESDKMFCAKLKMKGTLTLKIIG